MTQEARRIVNRLNLIVVLAVAVALALGHVPWSGLFIRPVGVAYDEATNTLSLYRHTPFGGVPARTEITLRTTGNLTCSTALPDTATEDQVSDFFSLEAPSTLRPCLDTREPIAVVWETKVSLGGVLLTPIAFDGLLIKVNR